MNFGDQIAQVCTNCGVCMGEYFCRACKFLDDDVSEIHLFPCAGWIWWWFGWLVDDIFLFCRLTRSNTIAKTAASAGIYMVPLI